jgi:CheY-like chemotaxis protein
LQERTQQKLLAERDRRKIACAFARKEDRERALAAGFDGHLTKPVDPERLVSLLTRWMRAAKNPSFQAD